MPLTIADCYLCIGEPTAQSLNSRSCPLLQRQSTYSLSLRAVINHTSAQIATLTKLVADATTSGSATLPAQPISSFVAGMVLSLGIT